MRRGLPPRRPMATLPGGSPRIGARVEPAARICLGYHRNGVARRDNVATVPGWDESPGIAACRRPILVLPYAVAVSDDANPPRRVRFRHLEGGPSSPPRARLARWRADREMGSGERSADEGLGEHRPAPADLGSPG